MKALCCFLLLCGVCISSNHAFGIRFGIRKAQVPEEAKQQTSSETPNADESKSSSDFASINRGLLKKTEEKISQLEKSLTSYLKPNAEESNLLEVPELINKTSKQLKKPDIYDNEDTIPLQVSNDLDNSETNLEYDLSKDTLINDHLSQQNKVSGLMTIDPDAELIDVQSSHPQAKYHYKVTNSIDETPEGDLSSDTRINDRISQQQASSGVVNVDPDAEFIDPNQHKGHIAQGTRANFKITQSQPSSRIAIERNFEPFVKKNSIDQVPAADLSRDILVNEHAANQVASGLIMTDPDAEFVSLDSKNSKYYYVPNTVQQVPVADLTRDTLVNERFAEQQEASGLIMIDPDSEFVDTRRDHHPSQNYYQTADRFQRTPGRDLSRDVAINDHMTQQAASGLIMIDPDAELINTDANNQNTYYYYVPNNIDITPRRKRTQRIYQRPVISYPQYPQYHQPAFAYYRW